MNEIEIQIEILNQVIKKTIGRIKDIQKQLEVEKQERKELGGYEDCGSFYQDAVIKTEAVISTSIRLAFPLAPKWKTRSANTYTQIFRSRVWKVLRVAIS